MEEKKHNTVYHWIDRKEQPRISDADNDEDMAELWTYIELWKGQPTRPPIYVYSSVDGWPVEPITDPTKLLE